MSIRPAAPSDLEQILKIYATARQYMRTSGNPHQWGYDKPDVSLLINDIALKQLFVIEENGVLTGCFACIAGADPTYARIDGGSWLNDLPYLTLHRVASAGIRPGILETILDWTSRRIRDIRIDTHADNKTMQHILEKNGFTRCGIIYLENGDPRLAYHRHTPEPPYSST